MPRRDDRSEQAKAYRRFYNTAQWKRTRRDQLAKQPLCERCLANGFIVHATVCNHVDPTTKLNPATFFDGPFSSACQPCHDQAIQSEERTGTQQTSRVGFKADVDAQGWPTDPRHRANRTATRR